MSIDFEEPSVASADDKAKRAEAPFWYPDMRAIVTLVLLASAVALIFMFALGLATVPENDIIKGAISTLLTLTTAGVYYYVGSTAQSRSKDETNKAQAETIASLSKNGKDGH